MNEYLIHWPLIAAEEEKNFFETTHRTCSPEKSWERWAPVKEKAGITRLSDITYLDCIGIPVYMAVRPIVDQYHENISVYNGKGLTKMQAKVSALMEAFERFSGERQGRPTIIANIKQVGKIAKAIDPRELNLPEGLKFDPEENLEWVVGLELFSKELRMVPACSVFFPYSAEQDARFFFGFANTDGLASGNTWGEAISQALAEVIERDAETLSELTEKATTIDLASIPSPMIQGLIQKFNKAGISLILKEVTSAVGIPTFIAAADEPATENPTLLCAGMGAHVNAEIAAMRAITEVAQSRCTQISGSREDMDRDEYKKKFNYHQFKTMLNYWYENNAPFKDFRTIPSTINKNLIQDIEVMMYSLKKNGFNEIIVVNLLVPEVGVPVVRVIVPGIEFSIDSGRPGKRAKALLKNMDKTKFTVRS